MVTLTYQERFKTVKGVCDAFTKRNLFELQTRGYFEELVSPIKVGKESNIFIARAKGEDSKGKETIKYVIVKIYRVQNADFSGMFKYIGQDPRYENLKKRRREIIFAWVQREFKNLFIANKAGVRVPHVHTVKNNVVVMDLIGDEKEGVVAMPLKDLVPQDPEAFLDEILLQVRKLWHKAGLAHGDLSSFNILNLREGKKDTPVLIDFSQATVTKAGLARDLLARDMKNVLQWFRKHGVKRDLDETIESVLKK